MIAVPASDNDLLYRIAMSSLKGMTIEFARIISSRVGSLGEFFTGSRSSLAACLSSNNRLLADDVRRSALEKATEEMNWVVANGVRALYYTDDDYPRRLLDCPDAPLMIYVSGNADFNSPHVIAIVGTRHATAYGTTFVSRFIAELSRKIPDLLVVSGLAYGIDVAAHRESISSNVPTVGVVAHGLATIYPAAHRSTAVDMVRNGGAILTDYRHSAPIHQGNFLARNRIVAGMSDAVLVIESGERGGALFTARLAADYGRDVFALPGRVTDVYSSGCNKIIYKNIASILTSVDDFIAAMRWTPVLSEGDQPTLNLDITPEQQTVIDYLTQKGEARINLMSVDLSMPISNLIQLLGEMEYNGLVVNAPGGRYILA